MKKIVNLIISIIISIFGKGVGKILGVLFVSMLPIVELRGAIPVGYSLGLPWYLSMVASIIGNLLPIPFILLYIMKIFDFLKKNKIFINIIEKIEKKAILRSKKMENNQFLGLILFVAIPLPGTGAWTGALIATLLKLDRKKSFLSILIGVLIASILITMGVYGLIDKFI